MQALKKVVGVAHARCTRVWVVDSEAAPFRPFSFRRTFDEYWADPLVVSSRGHGFPLWSGMYVRQGYLYNRLLALLGLEETAAAPWPTETEDGSGEELWPVYRHGD